MVEIEKITSRDNRRLAAARKVRDGREPKHIFIEGRRLAAEALRSDIEIAECFVAEGFRDSELLTAIAGTTIAIAELPEKLFSTIADTKVPQGIILIAQRPKTGLSKIESSLSSSILPTVIFLSEINNPANLGAILRTAEAAGAAGVIVSRNSADAYSPKALRAAMGSSFRLPIHENGGLDEILQWARVAKLLPVAADTGADRDHTEFDWKIPTLLILGSEAHGLSERELKKIDETVRIPMENAVESLNLAVSAGIILFEARRQIC